MAEKSRVGLKRSSTLLHAEKFDRDETFFTKFSLQQIIKESDPVNTRKTRIVCTIGYIFLN